MSRLAKFWVVTTPRPASSIGDILFEATPESFVLQVRGGLGPEDVPQFFDDEAEAREEATRLLAAFETYRRVLDGKETGVVTASTNLDAAIHEARKRAYAASEGKDALAMLEAETAVRLLDKKKDLVRYAVRLADTLMRTAERLEEEPENHFAANGLGIVQGAGLDVDRACAEVAVLRQALDDIVSARKAAER